jgi:hypothetical protein
MNYINKKPARTSKQCSVCLKFTKGLLTALKDFYINAFIEVKLISIV